MNEKEISALIKYWKGTAKHDHETMLALFRSRRYSDSLFFGHMVMEKILKALVAQKTRAHPKPIHNLIVLLQDAGASFLKEDIEFLAEVNKFNIRTRYPDYKLLFYKLCTLRYVRPKVENITRLYKKLCKLTEK